MFVGPSCSMLIPELSQHISRITAKLGPSACKCAEQSTNSLILVLLVMQIAVNFKGVVPSALSPTTLEAVVRIVSHEQKGEASNAFHVARPKVFSLQRLFGCREARV